MVNKVSVAQDITNSTFMLGAFAATAVSNAATLHRLAGRITTEALVTAAGASQDITVTNSHVTASDMVLAIVAGGTNTQGFPILKATPGAGQIVFNLGNDGVDAFNGTVVIDFWVLKRS
jgi:hypothetical protein